MRLRDILAGGRRRSDEKQPIELKAVLEALGEPAAVCEVDGRVVLANAAWDDALGPRERSLCGGQAWFGPFRAARMGGRGDGIVALGDGERSAAVSAIGADRYLVRLRPATAPLVAEPSTQPPLSRSLADPAPFGAALVEGRRSVRRRYTRGERRPLGHRRPLRFARCDAGRSCRRPVPRRRPQSSRGRRIRAVRRLTFQRPRASGAALSCAGRRSHRRLPARCHRAEGFADAARSAQQDGGDRPASRRRRSRFQQLAQRYRHARRRAPSAPSSGRSGVREPRRGARGGSTAPPPWCCSC